MGARPTVDTTGRNQRAGFKKAFETRYLRKLASTRSTKPISVCAV